MGPQAVLRRLRSWEASPLASGLLLLSGRGATGALPLMLTLVAARVAGLEGGGRFAAALAMAYALGEVADCGSQRYVPRLAATSGGAPGSALPAYNTLRFGLLGAGLVLAALWTLATEAPPRTTSLVVLASAGWAVASSGLYAQALVLGRFGLLGVGPVVPLACAAAVLTVSRLVVPDAGTSALAWALHVGRAAELVALTCRMPWPGFDPRLSALRIAWSGARYLCGQAALSAANARLIVPVAALAGGPPVAVLLATGLSVQAGASLVAVAASLPAYRRAVAGGVPGSVRQAVARTRRDLLACLGSTAAVTAALMMLSGWLLDFALPGADGAARLAVRLIVAAGLVESVGLFAGVYYHATFGDRLLLGLSVASAGSTWVLVALGVGWGGVSALGPCYLASRLLSAGMLGLGLVLWEGRLTRSRPLAASAPRAE